VQIVEEIVEFACDDFREGAFNQRPLLEESFSFTLRGRRTIDGAESIDLLLNGRLDRLDFNRNRDGLVDRIRVRDYKTSRNSASYAAMLRPEAFGIVTFQLPLYLMAALERFRAELATGVALDAGYLVLRHRDKLAQIRVDIALVETDPEIRGELSIANNIIALAASALRGEFDVDPRQCGEFCPFRRLCRYHKAMVSR
jgi:ATP-dependent helicase/DNAse subunit B